jgi:hypothetical protein
MYRQENNADLHRPFLDAALANGVGGVVMLTVSERIEANSVVGLIKRPLWLRFSISPWHRGGADEWQERGGVSGLAFCV